MRRYISAAGNILTLKDMGLTICVMYVPQFGTFSRVQSMNSNQILKRPFYDIFIIIIGLSLVFAAKRENVRK